MLNIGNKVYRNLPEQVAENMRQISKIWEKLDGLDVYDNVIVLENLDPLTPEQLEIIARPVSFIVYSNNVYMKRGVSGSDVLFDKVFQVSESSGTITFDTGEIIVTYPLGTISTNSGTRTTYSTTKIDSLLSAKLNASDLINLIFPVGAVYVSKVNTSPAGIIGGTWQALNSGNVIPLPTASQDPIITKVATIPAPTNVALRFASTTNGAVVTDTCNIALTAGATSGYSAGVSGTKYYELQPANLYSERSGNIENVYMWQRIA